MNGAAPDAPGAATGGGLAGLRVLDCADQTGTSCGTLLAALGATVRRAARGEDLGIGAPESISGSTGRDGRSHLAKPGDPAPFALVDAVILTGTPSALASRGLEPAVLLARHPHLIVAVISPFGLDGPRAEWRSCDTVAQAVGGMVWVNGHADGPPLRGLGPQAYHCAGLHAALGVVLALHARWRGAPGQLVDISLQESVCAALEHVSGRFDERGVVAARQGTLHWSGAFRAAACRDGLVLLSHLGDWTALLEWVKSDGAAADLTEPGWADETRRRVEAGHVFDVLAAWAARYRVADLLE
ncbi:MAG: CoA transferase, partial [Candidatus Binatia bacterium]